MKRIKQLIVLFQIGMLISGITAFFIPSGIHVLIHLPFFDVLGLKDWLNYVSNGIEYIDQHYSFFWYGTDWLAFAHILFAILFIGAYKDPVRNLWLFEFGIIASLLIVPTALLMGHIRHIPFIWQILDCCFGLIAAPLLWVIQKRIKALTAEFETDQTKYQINSNI